MTKPAKRGWTLRQQGKRRDILDAAIELFCEMGYQGMSIDALVERVGGSKSTIYSYFGDKEGLYRAAVTRFSELALEKNEQALRDITCMDDDSGSVEATLTEFLEGLLRATTTPEFSRFNVLCASSQSSFPNLGMDFFENGPGRSQSRIARYLAGADKRGVLKVSDPDMAAAALIGAVRANHLWARLFRPDMPAMSEQEIRKHVAYCIRMFMAAHAA